MLAILVLMVLGLQGRLWIGEGSLAHVTGLREIAEQKVSENRRKRLRNDILKAEIMDLRNGLDAIEEKARNDFGLIKKGEIFFLVLDDKSW